MAIPSKPPTRREEAFGECDPHEVFSHPAYGMVGMTVVTGGNQTLFGSGIKHGQRIRIVVNTAEHIRSISNDWHRGRRKLLEFEMTHLQFSEFITSQGRGDGIPCTLTQVMGECMPSIDAVETKQEMLRREIQDSAKRHMEYISLDIAKLGALIESGKLQKAELRELHSSLSNNAAGLPRTIAFVVERAEEALDNETTSARISIEATINHYISRIGLEAAQNIGLVSPTQEKITLSSSE